MISFWWFGRQALLLVASLLLMFNFKFGRCMLQIDVLLCNTRSISPSLVVFYLCMQISFILCMNHVSIAEPGVHLSTGWQSMLFPLKQTRSYV